MPKTIGRSQYAPRFQEVFSAKQEHGTYDMNDEECTDHSNNDMAAALEVESTDGETEDSVESLPVELGLQEGQGRKRCESLPVSFSENDRSRNREVSWSDSDGSTYISENALSCSSFDSSETKNKKAPLQDGKLASDSAPTKASAHEATKTTSGNPEDSRPPRPKNERSKQKSSIQEATATRSSKPTPRKNTAISPSPFERRRKRENQFIMEHVDYYSDVDAASTNDGLSEVAFISSEATRSIFCRRMIPLEIPVKKVFHRVPEEDISTALSSKVGSIMPTGDAFSVQAVHTRRGTVSINKKKIRKSTGALQNVEYITGIDVASNNNDISTVECRIPPQVAAPAFGKETRIPRNVPASACPDDLSSIGSFKPLNHVHYHPQIDSISTLGSSSVESNIDGNASFASNDDGINEDTVKINLAEREQLREPSSQGFDEPKVIGRPSVECLAQTPPPRLQSITDRRIRDLKEKIHNMQVSSTLAALPEDQQFKVSLSGSSKLSKFFKGPRFSDKHSKVPFSDDVKTNELSQARDYAAGVAILPNANFENFAASQGEVQSEKRVFGPGMVPSEVSPVLDESDDVSTIHCDFEHTERNDLIDVELGSSQKSQTSSRIPKQRKDAGMALHSKIQFESCLRKACHGISSLAQKVDHELAAFVVYQQLKSSIVGLWSKYMHGRTATEQAIIGIVFSSLICLFILLISLVA